MADSFQDRIGVFYSGLSKGHKRIADFIKNNYEKASFMTAAKLGKTVGVLGSTWLVQRFTRARLADGLSWWDVVGLALLGGIGVVVEHGERTLVARLDAAAALDATEPVDGPD